MNEKYSETNEKNILCMKYSIHENDFDSKIFWVQDWDDGIQMQKFVFELNIFDCGDENYFIIETI